MFHVISHQTEGRVATAMSGCGQQEHGTDMGKEGHTEVCEQISGHLSEQYGGGTQRSSGSIFLPRRQDICLPSMEMLQNIQKSPLFKKMQQDCKAEGIKIPKTLMAKDPITHVLNPTGIFMQRGSRDSASNEQSQCNEGNGRKHDSE